MADAIFEDPRLAGVYDPLDPDRSDLDVYLAIAEELGAHTVLDVGCGTGTFACLLACRGVDVVAVDPAAASLSVARAKRSAEAVRWLDGDATTLPPLQVDVAFMTANVAQVFLTDEEWGATLSSIHGLLRPDGWLVFETRVPAQRAWEQWTPKRSRRTVEVVGIGDVEQWQETIDVSGERVTFRTVTTFHRYGTSIESISTLRFRNRATIEASLTRAGFKDTEVGDAPDRPGREHVFLAQRL